MTAPTPPPQDVDALIDLVMAFVNAPSLAEKQRLVTENEGALLSARADTVLLNFMTRHADQEEYVKSLSMHRALLTLCRAHGVEAAFARLRGEDDSAPAPRISPEEIAFVETVTAFLNAETLEESERLLWENEALLLSDEADAFLDQLRDRYAGQEAVLEVIEVNRALLRRCREVGIELAYEEVRRNR